MTVYIFQLTEADGTIGYGEEMDGVCTHAVSDKARADEITMLLNAAYADLGYPGLWAAVECPSHITVPPECIDREC
jgi:hypothetical protein